MKTEKQINKPFRDAYERGYRKGVEDAAKAVETASCNDKGNPCYPCDCGYEVPQEWLPKIIRALLEKSR